MAHELEHGLVQRVAAKCGAQLALYTLQERAHLGRLALKVRKGGAQGGGGVHGGCQPKGSKQVTGEEAGWT